MNIKLETLPHASSYSFTLEGLIEISKIMEPEMEFKPETVSVNHSRMARWGGSQSCRPGMVHGLYLMWGLPAFE